MCLLEVLKRCKKAIGWQISDLKGISPLVCTHHIYMEEEAKPIRQPQRRWNPHLQEVVRAEVLKLLQAGIIYPIFDNPWVSPTQVVPKKSGITVVKNEKGEEVATRLTSGWRVCIDYRKLNVVIRNDHFPLPFIDQVLERVSGHPFYCFLDGYSGYFQIEINVEDQEKTTFTCPLEHMPTEECLLVYLIPPEEELCPAEVPPSLDILHPEFYPTDVPPSPDILHPEFHPTDVPPSPIFHIRRLTPDGRGGRFNFPCQTCPDPLIALPEEFFSHQTNSEDFSLEDERLGSSSLGVKKAGLRRESKVKDHLEWKMLGPQSRDTSWIRIKWHHCQGPLREHESVETPIRNESNATFQRCMLSIFSDMVERIIEVFMDDITIYGGIVLGHIISEKDIEVDKAKVELIVKLPSPTIVKGVRQFLGHVGFYRRFIKDFSKLSKPLCEILAKDAKFVWDERCQKSFDQLKQFLTTAPIVRAPNWQLPFEVMCDANDFAIGAVLGQREDGKPYVIYYASKTLNEAQRNYTTIEKELLVVMFALDKFHAYLVGSFIIVFTDHSSLKYLLIKQDAKARLIRWILLLQEFNLQIRDKKEVENVVADHLSSEWKAQDMKHFFAKIHAYYWEEPFLFKYCASQIIRKCVPEEEQQGILSHCHGSACGGHFAS
ncbi:Retrovirus-related Pol polyprotein from transposon 17.6 [Vitis vinifera]|uniref:Retrovirus-related Pol polyprotein from transposon 17.6 n=1 Tax=Vitis vinifera TaxID=29760 RepID=A0A438FQ33_VITVI|nr:Retrovirus-related Pol polyprotein from transposon 17.6 [Vitis vinifera]